MRIWFLGWLQLGYFYTFLYVECLRLWSLSIVSRTIKQQYSLFPHSQTTRTKSWYLALTGYMVAVVSSGVVSPGLFSKWGTTTS